MSVNNIRLVILAFLMLIGISIAQGTLPSAACAPVYTPSILPVTALGLALIALSISIDVVAIGYIVGKFFPSTGISNWINSEIWEIAKTALLIGSIFGLLIFMSNIALIVVGNPALTPSASYSGNVANLVEGAQSYLCTTLGAATSALQFIAQVNLAIGMLQSLNIYYYIPYPPIVTPLPFVFTFGFQMQPYVNTMLESSNPLSLDWESIMNDLFNFVVFPASILIIAQIDLLPIIVGLSLGILIPVGIILRAFPFIRGVGGTLIAMGIAGAIFYPSMLMLFNQPIYNALSSLPEAGSSFGYTGSCSIWLLCGSIQYIEGSLLGGSSQIAIDTASSAMTTIYPTINNMLTYVIDLMLAFILFVLDLAIIFPVTDELAKMLGSPSGIRLELTGRLKIS